MKAEYILDIDIGGTFIKYGIYDCAQETVETCGKVPTPYENQEALISTLLNIRNQYNQLNIRGCAISMPGCIKDGYVIQGGSLQYNNHTPFADILSKRLKLPVTIENDAVCAAEAELWKGKLQNVNHALLLVVGTGLGGAIIIDGKVYRGYHNYAGEVSLVFSKDRRRYGYDALLGAQVGIPNFTEKCNQAIADNLNTVQILEKINHGDERLNHIFSEYMFHFAQQIFNFQTIFDVEKILIGGGISENEVYMSALSKAYEDFYQSLPLKINHPVLEACYFHNEANLYGAVKRFLA